MKSSLERGLDRWQEAADFLNGIVIDKGTIDINNQGIWQGILHDWDNEDWILVLEAVGELYQSHRGFFKTYHKDALLNSTKILMDRGSDHPRILDTKPYKGVEWRMLMTLRELWNSCQDQYIPMTKRNMS